jgi:four helix bundle protein
LDKPHKKLKAWQFAMDVVTEVYRLSKDFPVDERYGLTAHVRKSAVSIASNIAEGAARNSKKEFIKFLYIARGSLSELDTQLELAKKLNVIDKHFWEKLDAKLIEMDKVLSGLIRSQKRLISKVILNDKV